MWRWLRGRAWGFRGLGAPWCPWSYWGRRFGYNPYPELTKEEERNLLEAWKKNLEAELEDIKRRLDELK